MNTALSKLSFSNFGMAAGRLLLPIDLKKCPFEVFPLANGFARPFDGEIVLLHVIDSASESSGRQLDTARRHLEHIARDFLRSSVEVRFRVRTGLPHEEIFIEASETKADLILLPVFAPSLWKRLVGAGSRSTARNIIGGAPCRVFVVDVRTRFNCLRRWNADAPSRRCAA
jgi:nucleotide-binding universal stress UspA family protein